MTTVATPSERPAGERRAGRLRSLSKLPNWAIATGVLVVLVAVSAYVRTRALSGQFWIDEAITSGISTHSLGAIPGILRHDGNPPLYYLLLHFWMRAFGTSEAATHSLSLLFGLLTIPVAMWSGWSLFGRRVGLFAAVMFATNAWLTQYAQETRMYELMALLGLIATTAFLHGFLYRRRRYLFLFAVALALMLYTHSWGIFFFIGALIALIPVYAVTEDRRGLLRDAALTFAAAGILFIPWIPNFIYQATHTGAPWSHAPGLGTPILISRDLLGGDRVTIALIIGCIAGLGALFTRRLRRSHDAVALWTLIVLGLATLLVAWLSSQITPAYVSRYFAPVLPAILLIAALGCARAGVVGIAVLIATVIFLVPHPGQFAYPIKSDMRNVAGQVGPLMHRGDLVVVAQPEQTPLAWYYLPGGLNYANSIGRVSDPSYMNWVHAQSRLQRANPAATLGPMVSSLRRGQQLLYVRPLTEGVENWEAPWTRLVRRRAAEWGALLQADVRHGVLKQIAWAPHDYQEALFEPDSAVLYRKVS
ncbi:MAG TPA: glycosyltransferase family 39 protein [Solirubrobacteraceae bacterium]|nr:glycosyltransferase family 39 protein [Solirubrobacteraceae bacterium]